jgi:hypothetical protein
LQISRLVDESEMATKVGKQAYRNTGTGYIATGLLLGVFSGFFQVILSRLPNLQQVAPMINYLSIPFWVAAAVLVFIGILYRRLVP